MRQQPDVQQETWMVQLGSVLVLQPDRGEPAIYAVSGFIEGTRNSAAQWRPERVNLTATLNGTRRDIPDTLHLEDASTGRRARAGMLPIAVYAPARDEAAILTPAELRPRSAKVPAPFACTLAFAPGLGDAPRLIATTTLRLTRWRAGITILCDLKVVEGKLCGAVCLSVKIAKDSGKLALAKTDVAKVVAAANAIWGCGPGNAKGPCCIKFTVSDDDITEEVMSGTLTVAGEDDSDTKKKLSDAAIERLLKTKRSATCWNVVLIHQLNSPDKEVGLTKSGTGGKKITGTIIPTQSADGKAVPIGDLGQVLAHEMGHAMGLASQAGEAKDGVVKHSSTDGNLMTATKTGTKLNADQCAKARQHAIVKPTADVCTCAPTE